MSGKRSRTVGDKKLFSTIASFCVQQHDFAPSRMSGLFGGTIMKSLLLAVLGAASVVAATPSRADPVDMSTVTCAQLLGMKQDEVGFMLTWIVGYMAGADEETSMDPDALAKHVADTVTYCTENQEMSVMNAAKESVPQ
jgi:hypothetical protein